MLQCDCIPFRSLVIQPSTAVFVRREDKSININPTLNVFSDYLTFFSVVVCMVAVHWESHESQSLFLTCKPGLECWLMDWLHSSNFDLSQQEKYQYGGFNNSTDDSVPLSAPVTLNKHAKEEDLL